MDRDKIILLFEELRVRLMIIAGAVFLFAIISFTFSDLIRELLLMPANMAYAGLDAEGLDLRLIFLTPSEALLANLRLSFITSGIVTLPLILYQLLALAITATGKPKRSAFFLTVIMYILFAIGLSFAYFVVLPFALNFFVGFSGPDLLPSFSIARYLSFTTSFMLSFGLVFQMPVLFWFLGSIGLLTPYFLRKNRKFALLIIIIFASILTPPDIFSQVLMAIPLLLLYELGIFMVYLSWRKKRRQEQSDLSAG